MSVPDGKLNRSSISLELDEFRARPHPEADGVIQASGLGMGFVHRTVSLKKLRTLGVFLILALIETTRAQMPSRDFGSAFPRNQLRTALHQGVSCFVFSLPTGKDRTITVLNQNLAAEGCFSIAVSNRRLAIDSPNWSAIPGAITFRHHRQFAVSLDGIEANYVRLTFDVRRPRARAK